MTYKTKFDVGDKIYYISNDRIFEDTISRIVVRQENAWTENNTRIVRASYYGSYHNKPINGNNVYSSVDELLENL